MSRQLDAWREIAYRDGGAEMLSMSRPLLREMFDEMDARASRAESDLIDWQARAKLAERRVEHYEGWFGTECRCDDEDCPL